MLKETENEEARLFCQTFVIGGRFYCKGPGALGHPPGYAYDFEIRSRP